MSKKQKVNEYINGPDDNALPSDRHVSMLNYLIGWNLYMVHEAMEWHKGMYPNENLQLKDES